MEKGKQEASLGSGQSSLREQGQPRTDSRLVFGGEGSRSGGNLEREGPESPMFGAHDQSWSAEKQDDSDKKDNLKIAADPQFSDDIELKNLLSISMQEVRPLQEEEDKEQLDKKVDIDVPIDLEDKPHRPLPPDLGTGSNRPYTVEEDLRILELFWYKERIGKYHSSTVYDTRKDRLCEEMHRTFESIRDRYKRYLKNLTPSEVTQIKKESEADPFRFYIIFGKSADGRQRVFKEVSKYPTGKKPEQAAEKKQKASPGPKSEEAPQGEGGEGGEEKASPGSKSKPKKSSGEPKNLKRGPLYKLSKKQFDLENYVAPDFVLMAARTAGTLKRIRINPGVINERERYATLMRGVDNRVAVKYDGKEYLFEFVDAATAGAIGQKTPTTKGVIESIEQLLGVEGEQEAIRVFESVSCDVGQLKQLIGGNARVVFKPIDDETLKAFMEDKVRFASYYERLVKDKGEEAVNKRIEYLTKKK